MSGGGIGSTGVTQSGGGSSFGMNQPSQGMGQASPQPMQGPFGGLGNMQVSPYNSTSQQNILGGQQGMGQGFQQPNSNLLQQDAAQAGTQFLDFYNQQVAGLIPGPKTSNRTVNFPSMQPMQQGPFGGQFGNMFGGPQFGFQQPQPFYQQQFNPYAMASQAQRLGISQVPIRNQYGPYGGQMYQQPYQMPYRNLMQQPMQQPQTNYPQPMGYPQPMQNLQQSSQNYVSQITDPKTGRTFDLNGPVAQDWETSSAHARAMEAFKTNPTSQQAPYGGFGNEQYQNKLNFARQQLAMRGIPQQQFDPNRVMHHGIFRRPMPRHMMPPEMQGPNVSDTIVDTGKVDMTSPAEAPMTAQDILKMAVGKSTPDLRYDSNGDGKITSADALAFQRSMQQKGMA